jgi:hypothetical protein
MRSLVVILTVAWTLVVSASAGATKTTACGDLGRSVQDPQHIVAVRFACRSARVVALHCGTDTKTCVSAGHSWRVRISTVRGGARGIGLRVQCFAGPRVVAWTLVADG